MARGSGSIKLQSEANKARNFIFFTFILCTFHVYILTYLLTCLLTYLLTYLTYLLAHSLTHSLTHSPVSLPYLRNLCILCVLRIYIVVWPCLRFTVYGLHSRAVRLGNVAFSTAGYRSRRCFTSRRRRLCIKIHR